MLAHVRGQQRGGHAVERRQQRAGQRECCDGRRHLTAGADGTAARLKTPDAVRVHEHGEHERERGGGRWRSRRGAVVGRRRRRREQQSHRDDHSHGSIQKSGMEAAAITKANSRLEPSPVSAMKAARPAGGASSNARRPARQSRQARMAPASAVSRHAAATA